MKKLLALVLITFLLFSLSACDNNAGATDKNSTPAQNNPTQGTQTKPTVGDAKIARDKAIEIALEKAKLQKADVYDLEAELDYEKGILVWEVDFDYQNSDYSYDINADTGKIIFEEVEKDYK